eukprot:CAMPEP_0198738088 /NCGR_PEP_ID=MMETSP1475-20131203/68197_1 /TAXON_ID= ORGANISM="Unidentified sp., Strain CCMP1999" /NCGR_SAMPLE_ID=MMETSP1475 /ASSEMBLY_ACC=CAM_ASM_001111 /LENGTH=722 /DNA_ID=CAMNT_0044501959 /DNA_START=14 /DNA_END=2182 /DNA_ORIENTATION=-
MTKRQVSVASFFRKPTGGSGVKSAAAAVEPPTKARKVESEAKRSDCESGDRKEDAEKGLIEVLQPSDESPAVSHDVAQPRGGSAKDAKGPPPQPTQDDSKVSALVRSFAELKEFQPVPYLFLARAYAHMESITGRIEITSILSQVFREIIRSSPRDLVPAIYLSINKLSPAHVGLEIGVGESILLRALSAASGRSLSALKETFQKVGDLGDVAMAVRTTQRTMFTPAPLTVAGVFKEFKAIAQASGKAAVDEKKSRMQKLLVSSKDCEAKFIARALQGKLRIHLAEKTVIAALADAFRGPKEVEDERSKESILTQAYNQHPVWETIVGALLESKVVDSRLLELCKLAPGVPFSPMLAKPTKGVAEVLEKFSVSTFTCEYKYDGERAQIHRLADGTVKMYSRNAEDQTVKYPDVVQAVNELIRAGDQHAEFIIDAEIVAFDNATQKILPFQQLQGRARKDVSVANVKITVCVFAFDLLYLNRPLISETLKERRRILHESFDEKPGVFSFAIGKDTDNMEEIMDLLNDSIKVGCEGLMVKALEGPASTYEPANRSQNWLKVKKDYLEGLTDSLDLVPVGGYYGRGKRTGVFGAFLLACYDTEREEYATACKIGTGFSEEMLLELSEHYKKENRTLLKPKPYYAFSGNTNLTPDVWLEPSQVWEIRCADFTLSPAHTAAMGTIDDNKGVALRFPRFLRVRNDKGPENATSADQIAEMYLAQKSSA